MKSKTKSSRKRATKGLQTARGQIPPELEGSESLRPRLPTLHGPRAGDLFVPGARPLSDRSMLDAADEPTAIVGAEFGAGHGSIIDRLTYSDHMFHDVLSVALHALAARKILDDPSLVEGARETLEKWISRHQRAPRPFVE